MIASVTLQNKTSRKVVFDSRDEKTTDVWLTPPYVFEALGDFDLDPCAATNRPWDTAKKHFTIEDDGLSRDWFGRVWMNPPYGDAVYAWIERLSNHGNGIALVAARTETIWFHKFIWEAADGVLFRKRRLCFYDNNGHEGDSAPFPSCFVAYGEQNAEVLKNITDERMYGKYVALK